MSAIHQQPHWKQRMYRERVHLATTLPAECIRCGSVVTKDMAWDVDHVPALSEDPDVAVAYVAHRRCNRSHGQQLGQRKTGRRSRAAPRPDRDFLPVDLDSAAHQPGFVMADTCPPPHYHPEGFPMPRLESAVRPGTSFDLAEGGLAWVDVNAPGEPLMPWQRYAFRRMLETVDGRPWSRVLLLVSRQQGKTYLIRRLLLHRLLSGHRLFGPRPHLLNVAPVYNLAADLLEPWARELSAGTGGRVHARTGSFDWWAHGTEDGPWWISRAMRRGSITGQSLSTVFVDEVQDADYDLVMRTISPTMTGTRVMFPQLILAGTGARAGLQYLSSGQSRLLRELRSEALDGGDVLLLEWSAPPDVSVQDRTAWRWASPDWSSYRETALEKDAGRDIFPAEYLVHHADIESGVDATKPVVDPTVWLSRRQPGLHVPDSGRLVAAMDAGIGDPAVAVAWHGPAGDVCVIGWTTSSLADAWRQISLLPPGAAVLVGWTWRNTQEAVSLGAKGVSADRGTNVALPVMSEMVRQGGLSWDGDELAEQMVAMRVRDAKSTTGWMIANANSAEIQVAKVAAWAAYETAQGDPAPQIW